LLRRAFVGKRGLRLGVMIVAVLATVAPNLIGTRAEEQAAL